MVDDKVPDGLSRLSHIFWRVEVEDKDIRRALKEIVGQITREKKGE